MDKYAKLCRTRDILERAADAVYSFSAGERDALAERLYPLADVLPESDFAAIMGTCFRYSHFYNGDTSLLADCLENIQAMLKYINRKKAAGIYSTCELLFYSSNKAEAKKAILDIVNWDAGKLNKIGGTRLIEKVYDLIKDFIKSSSPHSRPAARDLLHATDDMIEAGGLESFECVKDLAERISEGGLNSTREFIANSPGIVAKIAENGGAALVGHACSGCMAVSYINGYLAKEMFENAPSILNDINDNFSNLLVDKIKELYRKEGVEKARSFISKDDEYCRFLGKIKNKSIR